MNTGIPASLFAGQISMGFAGASFSGADAAAFDAAVDTLKASIGF
jgi:hypothetical protein